MRIPSLDTFATRAMLDVNGTGYRMFSLAAAERTLGSGIRRLPVSLRVLLENLLRHEDGDSVAADDIRALAAWVEHPRSDRGVALNTVRVVLPDGSGVPLLVELAAMRDAMVAAGDDPRKVDPFCRVDLVVDHAVTAEHAGTPDAYRKNLALEFEENRERYELIKWAQREFRNVHVIPPGAGIVHQVNLEYLSRPIWSEEIEGERWAFPDSLVATDSHTPMINALGVMGWGVGGIEACSAILGEPISLVIPEVVGCRIVGRTRPGVTATDVVLTLTQRLRRQGVVGKWVEFHGPGVRELTLTDRATLANMSPEYGATMGFFPIDQETLRYLRLTGRREEDIALAEAYAKAQGLWAGMAEDVVYSDTLDFDLGTVEPSAAGPRRPQDRHPLARVRASFTEGFPNAKVQAPAANVGGARPLRNGDVVIAAITSCTNTSNPAVLVAAGLLARNARHRGLVSKPWVKTSLSPGSAVVSDYLQSAGLQSDLDALGFHLTGYGCMTCSGGSGSLAPEIAASIERDDLAVCAVLSGNRNFEGRIHPDARAAYLVSPPLVVAYAIAGSVLLDLTRDALGTGADGEPVFLKDIWPSDDAIADCVARHLDRSQFLRRYANADQGESMWQALPTPAGATYAWDPASTMLRRPPYFDEAWLARNPRGDFTSARVLAILGDSVTTDHIAPMGQFSRNTPAWNYLASLGVPPRAFGTYILRRANHEVLIRGAFANIRLKNRMVAPKEGGYSRHHPSGDVLPIYEVAERYAATRTPAVVFAGKEYGNGSSRDWAAKGPAALGVRAIIAESFERIHRSNLAGMGVVPLELPAGVTIESLGLDGSETVDVKGLGVEMAPRTPVAVTIRRASGSSETLTLRCRLDTRREVAWYAAGGILNHVYGEIRRRG